MYCRNCSNQVEDRAVACTKCGVNPRDGVSFCQACGKPTAPNAVACPSCGAVLTRVAPPAAAKSNNKVVAGVCGILLGALGVHKFILGYTGTGLIMLLVSVLSCGILASVMGLIGLIEGIIYLTKSDEDFVNTYVQNKRTWF